MKKKLSKAKDPYREREAQKYEQPIPSREFILELMAERGVPLTFEQIAAALELVQEQDLEALRRRLKAMQRDGQLICNRRDEFGLIKKMDLISGRVLGHPDGFGFLYPDDGGDDIYLSAKVMRSLLHGDRAVVTVTGLDRRGRREGALVEVLERANHNVVGRFHMEHGLAIVIPSNKRINQDILIPAEYYGQAQDGQIVVIEIIEQPSPRAKPIGKVVEIVGDHMAPGMEIDVAIRSFDLPYEWPQAVLDEVAPLFPEVEERHKHGRVDLREFPLVTIDGEDARDFDDAVYCERAGKNWRLIVAIADVSSYVQRLTALDEEAKQRGNSVYFPGRVIPMLPEILSNGLCSLNPNVDRLCLACELLISPAGVVLEYRFFEAMMRSAARLTYTEVAAMVVERKVESRKKHSALLPHLEDLYELYKALQKRREKRGTIEFETTETRIVFGHGRKIERIVPVIRNDAHRMIEEFMVAANVAAAEFLLSHKIAALYRIHAGPAPQKLADLRQFLAELGLRLEGGDEPLAKHYAKLLSIVRGRPDAHLIQTVLLRSLSQAVYSPDNIGHFGLAYEAYTHFTSPIRRYPDLLVHRAIRHLLAQNIPERFIYSSADMLSLGDHCSMTERRADEATRDAVDWLKCEFMQNKVGEVYPGVITAVTGFGIFVELADIYVEGLVHVTALDNDYFHFDAVKHRLVGERTKMTYRLADTVHVKVVRVDLDERKIDFEIAQLARKTTETAPRARVTKSKKKRR